MLRPQFLGVDDKQQRYTVTAEVAMRPERGPQYRLRREQTELVQGAARGGEGRWPQSRNKYQIRVPMASALREELQSVRVMELHARAAAEGVGEALLEDAMDSAEPWAALIELYKSSIAFLHFNSTHTAPAHKLSPRLPRKPRV